MKVPRRTLVSGPCVLAVLVSILPAPAAGQRSPPDLIEVTVASVGLDLQNGAPLALLHSEWEHLLPVWIGEVEFEAILRGLRGEVTPRPLTHDLLLSTVTALGGELEEVRVVAVVEGTYIGSLHVRVGEGRELREVDSRPSDALALAVRSGARIRVARGLVASAPDVDFVAASGAVPVVRYRGVTLREGEGGDPGLEVLHVTGPASAGGLRTGDRIVRVDGVDVDRAMVFLERMRGLPEGGAVPVRVLRGGSTVDVRLPPRRGEGRVG